MNYEGLLFFEEFGQLLDGGYYLGKRRVKGIYQTGRRAEIKERLKKGDRLRLERDYKNKYDLYAIAVYDSAERRIGYIERSGNLDVSFVMDHGLLCYANVYELDKASVTVGVLIEVYCAADRNELYAVKEEFSEFLRKESIKI